MSYYGGGSGQGGDWVPPPFFNFNQPPGMMAPPVPFYTDAQGNVIPTMQIPPPDFQQQAYNQFIPASVAGQSYPPGMVPPPVPSAVPASVKTSTPSSSASTPATYEPSSISSDKQRTERGYSSRQRRSPSPHGQRERGRSPPSRTRGRSPVFRDRGDYSPLSRDKGRSPPPSDRAGRSRRDAEDDRRGRYQRNPEVLQQKAESEERRRSAQRGGSPPRSSSSNKPSVDIDALLQDERLRNVLFAGISKATAKLEQSLQGNEDDVEPKGGKTQSYSSSSKPRSILKQQEEAEGSATLHNLSALEKTLQLLRSGKAGRSDVQSPTDRSPPERKSRSSALSKLGAYDEDKSSQQYEKESLSRKSKPSSSKSRPFWSAPSEKLQSPGESDYLDPKEKMYEEWRQSIQKPGGTQSQSSQREKLPPASHGFKDSFSKSDLPSSSSGQPEELDSTVQNVLQSIGFNFDLSRRMQELARKKKRTEDAESSGITNAAASFLDKGSLISDELKASLLRSGSDVSEIDALIKEARSGSLSRHRNQRSPSPGDKREFDYDYERGRGGSQTSKQSNRDESEKYLDDYRKMKRYDDRSPSPRHGYSPKRVYRDSISPERMSNQSRTSVSERFRQNEKSDYYYPEKEHSDYSLPSLLPLTSLSSRPRSDQQQANDAWNKIPPIQNFRVTSKPEAGGVAYDNDMRRVILPEAGESPERLVTRKRSASPSGLPPASKERKVDYDQYYKREGTEHTSTSRRDRSASPSRRASPRRRSPPRRRSRSKSPRRRSRSKSPRRRSRSKSPRRRSPYRRRTPSPRSRRSRSKSPRYRRSRSKSPRRRRSRSKSPNRRPRITRSPIRRRDGRDVPDDKDRKIAQPVVKNAQPVVKRAEVSKPAVPEKKTLDEKEVRMAKASVVTTAFEMLVKLRPSDQNRITEEVLKMTPKARQQCVVNVHARRKKVNLLKTDLDQLKKAQNELMRKSQRSGVGIKNPQINAYSQSQGEIEKEITRLTVKETDVLLDTGLEQRLQTIQRKLVKDMVSFEMAKMKAQGGSKKDDDSEKADGDSIANALDDSKTSTWTSVLVSKDGLPAVGEAKDKTPKSKSASKPEVRKSTEKKTEKGTTSRRGNEKKPVKEKETEKVVTMVKPKKNIYYEYVESGNHWCRDCLSNCNAFDQYFNHLHGKKHLNMVSYLPKPWLKAADSSKVKKKVGQSQTRRVKGSEMFYPVSGLYCTICDVFCGDYAHADAHLKSDAHYDKYLDFLRVNPGYEKELLLEKTTKVSKRNKNRPPPPEMDSTPAGTPVASKIKTPKSTNATPVSAVNASTPVTATVSTPTDAVATPTPDTPKSAETAETGSTGKKPRKRKKKKNLRVAAQEAAAGDEKDNTEVVDMDLDDDEESASKVPKLGAKFNNSVAALLKSMPDMSQPPPPLLPQKDEGVQSLDKFLSIPKEQETADTNLTDKLPLIEAKKTGKKSKTGVVDIPIPAGPQLPSEPGASPLVDLNAIPVPQQFDTTAIPVPVEKPNEDAAADILTPTSSSSSTMPFGWGRPAVPLTDTKPDDIKDKLDDEQRMEKSMMGIDVDAEVEKEVAHVKPPPSVTTKKEGEGTDKSKTIDNLFAKANFSTVGSKTKVSQKSFAQKSDLELKIEQKIYEKLEQEKQKIIKKREMMERKAQKELEKTMEKEKKVTKDSSGDDSDGSDLDELVNKDVDEEGKNEGDVKSQDSENDSKTVDAVKGETKMEEDIPSELVEFFSENQQPDLKAESRSKSTVVNKDPEVSAKSELREEGATKKEDISTVSDTVNQAQVASKKLVMKKAVVKVLQSESDLLNTMSALSEGSVKIGARGRKARRGRGRKQTGSVDKTEALSVSPDETEISKENEQDSSEIEIQGNDVEESVKVEKVVELESIEETKDTKHEGNEPIGDEVSASTPTKTPETDKAEPSEDLKQDKDEEMNADEACSGKDDNEVIDNQSNLTGDSSSSEVKVGDDEIKMDEGQAVAEIKDKSASDEDKIKIAECSASKEDETECSLTNVDDNVSTQSKSEDNEAISLGCVTDQIESSSAEANTEPAVEEAVVTKQTAAKKRKVTPRGKGKGRGATKPAQEMTPESETVTAEVEESCQAMEAEQSNVDEVVSGKEVEPAKQVSGNNPADDMSKESSHQQYPSVEEEVKSSEVATTPRRRGRSAAAPKATPVRKTRARGKKIAPVDDEAACKEELLDEKKEDLVEVNKEIDGEEKKEDSVDEEKKDFVEEKKEIDSEEKKEIDSEEKKEIDSEEKKEIDEEEKKEESVEESESTDPLSEMPTLQAETVDNSGGVSIEQETIDDAGDVSIEQETIDNSGDVSIEQEMIGNSGGVSIEEQESIRLSMDDEDSNDTIIDDKEDETGAFVLGLDATCNEPEVESIQQPSEETANAEGTQVEQDTPAMDVDTELQQDDLDLDCVAPDFSLAMGGDEENGDEAMDFACSMEFTVVDEDGETDDI